MKTLNTLLGCGVVILSNTCLLAVSYLAKHQPFSPGEMMSMRSLLQVIVFGVWSTYQGIWVDPKPLKHDNKTWMAVGMANFVVTVTELICFTAVKLVPLSDFIVFVFTSPVFTLAASYIILRYEATACNFSERNLCG